MKNTAVADLTEKLLNDDIEANLDNIKIHHRDEVLKRLANFKEKTNDF